MKIKTKRLLLVPHGIKFLNTVHEYATDLETTKYMVWLPNETIEETAEFLKRSDAEWAKEVPSYYEFASEELGVKRFQAHCDSENTASSKVMEKLGMKKISCEGGRKNKSSDEERYEFLYELNIIE